MKCNSTTHAPCSRKINSPADETRFLASARTTRKNRTCPQCDVSYQKRGSSHLSNKNNESITAKEARIDDNTSNSSVASKQSVIAQLTSEQKLKHLQMLKSRILLMRDSQLDQNLVPLSKIASVQLATICLLLTSK